MQNMEAIPWEKVEESSNVNSLYWSPVTQEICVRFHNGGIYTYAGAPERVYMDLRYADSVGRYLNRVVKQYPFTKWENEGELLTHLNK